jgi:transcriptional regulator with XRE-family HTH domain
MMETGTANQWRGSAGDITWMRDWGHLLRIARQVAGLSLTALSARTGLSKGYLSKLESGHHSALNPSRATLAALARALPSFRTLAHMLDPDVQPSALAQATPTVPEFTLQQDGTVVESQIRLGWRELELLVAFIALEQSAAAQPLTPVVLARAVSRDLARTHAILDELERLEIVRASPPAAPGRPPVYSLAPGYDARLGVSRVGDALILAGALLSRPALHAPQGENDPRA